MSTLELARQACEDIEIYETAIAEQLDKKPKITKQLVWQQHRINNLVARIQERSKSVVETVIRDEDGSFKEELAARKGENAFGAFYSSLKETKDFHAKYPFMDVRAAPLVESEMACTASFSGEEMWGKYLDLHSFHERSLNMKPQFHHFTKGDIQPQPQDYVAFVDTFHQLDKVPRGAKQSSKYAAYVRDLCAYLVSFLHRTQPLVDVDAAIQSECAAAFEAAWAKGEAKGWEMAPNGRSGGTGSDMSTTTQPKPVAMPVPKPVDMSAMHSVSHLEALGPVRLKEGLEALGLKAGGSVRHRAARLLSVKGLSPEDFPKKARAPHPAKKKQQQQKEEGGEGGEEGAAAADAGKAADAGGKQGTRKRRLGSEDAPKVLASGPASPLKALALLEATVRYLATVELEHAVAATKRHVEKKHTMRLEERIAEYAAEDDDDDDEEKGEENGDGETGDGENDDDEGPLYNPLNLPLGWDGKPIPYWLYKLHGLGVEYKCEICGNASYFGRRAFDRHFQEWRHAYGMRCLGIPNTKHFHDICLIEDASALYTKLKATLKAEEFDAAASEEYEDSDGHVLNRKTYEDLARQGLL